MNYNLLYLGLHAAVIRNMHDAHSFVMNAGFSILLMSVPWSKKGMMRFLDVTTVRLDVADLVRFRLSS
jgi:hypothetical protein